MPPHDASNRDSDAWSRLQHFVDKAKRTDSGRAGPGPVSCKRPLNAPQGSASLAYEDEDDGPITTRWAVG